ncbi:serine hydrolase domain-containing protein [Halomarina rubra]|uniref:Serine hydrolase domain-containing protein n=1 Tax=Halomarina rubra TaxID=2071873 RepID=A0ABD6AVS9_9EURY|nr:serine hydrolase domain-containing protein [Halomarina rubra]
MVTRTAPIRGTVADGFEPVLAAFRENVARRGELGAACAVYHRGECVVDLWGGYRDADRTEPWAADTLVLVFSTTKGVAATTMAHAHAQGLFDYDDRVADHWPSFGVAGKREVTVRQLLAHRAGVAAIDETLTPERIADRENLTTLLAGKRPDWPPGERHGYHAWSLGWYESELLQRTDPEGRTLGRYFAEELAAPLDVEFYVGLPDDVAEERVAAIEGFGLTDLLTSVDTFPPRLLLALANPRSLSSRALSPFAMSSPAELNDPAYRSLEVPAGTGVGRVRDVARLYGLLASDPASVGLDEETVAELRRPARPPSGGARDVVLKTDTAYTAGFWKPTEGFAFGSPAAFGAPGAGGSFAFADPARALGFAYAPNRMGTHLWDDPRERALRDAVDDCLAAL